MRAPTNIPAVCAPYECPAAAILVRSSRPADAYREPIEVAKERVHLTEARADEAPARLLGEEPKVDQVGKHLVKHDRSLNVSSCPEAAWR